MTPDSEAIFTKCRERGERAAEAVSRIVDANELERKTINAIEAKVRHGYKFINLTIRKDGVETTYEADWLARLLRSESFSAPTTR